MWTRTEFRRADVGPRDPIKYFGFELVLPSGGCRLRRIAGTRSRPFVTLQALHPMRYCFSSTLLSLHVRFLFVNHFIAETPVQSGFLLSMYIVYGHRMVPTTEPSGVSDITNILLAVEFLEARSYCRCKGFTFRTRWQILFEFELCEGDVPSHLH